MDAEQHQVRSMGPPLSSPNGDKMHEFMSPEQVDQHSQPPNGIGNAPVGANVAAQQPKVVQTAFIHKLYK